ncbi:MAG: AAA family ATPase [Alphaproteobacteria bacterium]
MTGNSSTGNNPLEWSIRLFAAHTYYAGPAPVERHLIKNFLVHKATTALVADGGVGKTYIALELALRAACGSEINGQTNLFMGFPISEKCKVIMLTMEDGKEDIHRRLDFIDPNGELRETAGDYCCIVPVREQLADGLVLAEKDKNGGYTASKVWKELIKFIRNYDEELGTQEPLIIIIDTYSATHHADENSATGTNEWFRAAGLLKQLDATLIITHHVRKTDPNYEIRTPTDMRLSVRGSNAFMNAIRACYGIWEMPNANAVISEMGVSERTTLYNMGLLKNNTGISWDGRSDPRYLEPMITLRRAEKGMLVFDDKFHKKRLELASDKESRLEELRKQLRAAIILACRWYAEHQWPLSKANLTREKDVFLPDTVNHLGYKNEIEPLINQLLADGWIKQIKIKGTNGHILDVVNGPYASGLQAKRIEVTPVLPWDEYEYDSENNEYIRKQ